MNCVVVVDDCKGVSLGRSGSKGEGEVEGVDGLGSGGVSGWPLLPFEMVSWTALGNVNARGVGPSRVMSSMEWWVGKESARGSERGLRLGSIRTQACARRLLLALQSGKKFANA